MAKKKDLEQRAKEKAIAFYREMNAHCRNIDKYSRNLTLLYAQNKLDEVYYRDTEAVNIQKILLRKNKSNVLLTGRAGCGKTAIAERLASVFYAQCLEWCKQCIIAEDEYLKKRKEFDQDPEKFGYNEPEKEKIEPTGFAEAVLYDFSITTAIAGARYVGDTEERIGEVVKECANNPNVILFIDEIHTMMGAGAGDKSHNDIAQILKPALARSDIRVIGATTTEEAEILFKDKALARRFNEIKVEPLSGSSALETASKIMADYSAYHKVDYANVNFADILYKLKTFLPKSVFPDNFINIVDETFAGAKFDNVEKIDMTHLNATLSRMAGVVIL